MLDGRALEAQRKGDAAAVIGLIAGGGIDAERQDLFRRAGGHLFDVHAALGRADKGHAAGLAIDQQREIEFAVDVGTVFDVDAVDLLAGRAGLMGDQCLAQHLLGFFGGLFDRLGQPHAALFAGALFLEGALAAATGVNLGLDDPERPVHLASLGLGLVRLQNDAAIGYRRAVGAKQCLRLILMNVHGSTVPSCCNCIVPLHIKNRFLNVKLSRQRC